MTRTKRKVKGPEPPSRRGSLVLSFYHYAFVDRNSGGGWEGETRPTRVRGRVGDRVFGKGRGLEWLSGLRVDVDRGVTLDSVMDDFPSSPLSLRSRTPTPSSTSSFLPISLFLKVYSPLHTHESPTDSCRGRKGNSSLLPPREPKTPSTAVPDLLYGGWSWDQETFVKWVSVTPRGGPGPRGGPSA